MACYNLGVRGTAKESFRLPAPSLFFIASITSLTRRRSEAISSPEFLRLTLGTQRTYGLVIERLIRNEKIGHRLVAEMTREHVKRIVAKRAATPGAANDVLKKLRILVRFAIDNGWRSDDPCLRIKDIPGGRVAHVD
jgi:hypothetical protein